MRIYENEYELQIAVQEYLKRLNIYYYHIPRNSGKYRNQLAGLYDLFCIGYGKVFFIELKNPTKKRKLWDVKISQIKFGKILNENKIDNIMSNDYNEIIDFINKIIKAN